MTKLSSLIPFMEEKDLKELALKIINGEVEGVKLSILMPFLNEEDLDEIVDLLIEKKRGKDLRYVVPFVSEETISKIQEASKSGEIEGFDDTYLLPFLGKRQLKNMFDDIVERTTKKYRENKENNTDTDEE